MCPGRGIECDNGGPRGDPSQGQRNGSGTFNCRNFACNEVMARELGVRPAIMLMNSSILSVDEMLTIFPPSTEGTGAADTVTGESL